MSKAFDLLGVVSPSSSIVARAESADVPMAYVVAPAVVCGIAGYHYAGKHFGHPVLGFFAGESIGANAYRLYRGQGDDRTQALCGLGTQACAVVGSLRFKEHPFWGYVLGFVAGSAITALVPGSNAHRLLK